MYRIKQCDRTFLIRLSKVLHRIADTFPDQSSWISAVPESIPDKGAKEHPAVLEVWRIISVQASQTLIENRDHPDFEILSEHLANKLTKWSSSKQDTRLHR